MNIRKTITEENLNKSVVRSIETEECEWYTWRDVQFQCINGEVGEKKGESRKWHVV